jgi:hypothetical protein
VVNATPRPLYPREGPSTHCKGGLASLRAGLDGCRKSRPHRDSIPGPVSHLQSLYRLSYPAPQSLGHRGYFPRSQESGSVAEQLPSSGEVKKGWRSTSTPPICRHGAPHIPLSANRVLSLYDDFQAQVFHSLSLLLHLNVQPIVISLNNYGHSSKKHSNNTAGYNAASFSALNSCSLLVLCFIPRRNFTQAADHRTRKPADGLASN